MLGMISEGFAGQRPVAESERLNEGEYDLRLLVFEKGDEYGTSS